MSLDTAIRIIEDNVITYLTGGNCTNEKKFKEACRVVKLYAVKGYEVESMFVKKNK